MLIDNYLAQFSSERFNPATDGNRCRVSKPNITWTLGNPMKDGEEGFRGAREAKDTRIKPTESKNFDSYGFPDMELGTREFTWDMPRPSTHMLHLHGWIFLQSS